MKKLNTWFALAISATLLTGCSSMQAPDVINFKKTALYPEGIKWDAGHNRFIVTSIRQGIVGAVKDDGSYEVIASDPRMVSAVGVYADAKRDRLLVCNADPGASIHSSKATTGKLAGLAVFRLSTGSLIRYIDLAKGIGGAHFCNDLALAEDGSAYITDSFNTIIYKVTPDYQSSVFLSDSRFGGNGFNLNGIVVQDNYLLVNKFNDGTLFKVPLDNPKAFTQVKIDQTFTGADGLVLMKDGSLVIVVNDSVHRGGRPFGAAGINDRTVRLTSTDNWASAKLVESNSLGEVGATTGARRGDEIYAIYSMLQVLFDPKTKQHPDTFSIHKQKF